MQQQQSRTSGGLQCNRQKQQIDATTKPMPGSKWQMMQTTSRCSEVNAIVVAAANDAQ
jgi:hypothetical protein